MSEIVVKKVYLQEDLVDRLRNTIELKDSTIKYQQNEFLKLQKKLDNRENFGINNLLFSYDELLVILKNKHHPLYDYIHRWFDEDIDEGLFFSEDGIEVEQGDYWLVNVITDVACKFNNRDKLNRMIYKLESSNDN